MLRGVEKMNPRTIAQLELEAKVIPIKIVGPLPNGKKELWKLSELILKKEYIVYNFNGGDVDMSKIEETNKEIQAGGYITGYKNITGNSTKLTKY